MLEKMFFLSKGEYLLENRAYIGYGIGCCIDGNDMIFEDLSTDREKVQNLVDICNRSYLSPLHLCDVVSDFLNDHE